MREEVAAEWVLTIDTSACGRGKVRLASRVYVAAVLDERRVPAAPTAVLAPSGVNALNEVK